MSLSNKARRRLVVATTSEDYGNEIADAIEGPVIVEPLALHVDVQGNDENSGTANKPLATIQAAVDKFRGARIDSSVLIKVGAGTFDGFQLDQLSINESTTGGKSGTFTVEGTMVAATVSTGTNSGTTTGGGTTYLDDSTQSWTPGELKGKFLSVPDTGTDPLPIVDNTATRIYVPIQISMGQAGWNYNIQEIATFVSKTVSNGNTASACHISIGNTGSRVGSSVLILKMALNVTSGSGIISRSSASNFLCRTFKISTTGSAAGVTANYGTVAFQSTLFESNGTGTLLSCSGFQSAYLALNNSYFKKTSGGASTALALLSHFRANLVTNIIDGFSVGVQVGSSVATILFSSNTLQVSNSTAFKNNTTAISANPSGNFISLGASQYFTNDTNTTLVSLTKGAKCQIESGVAQTGSTTEISVDGTAYTLATMRANTPKAVPTTPNAYGTVAYE